MSGVTASVSHLSVLGGEAPLGGGPLGGNQGALQLQVGGPRGGAGVLHGGKEVLRGGTRGRRVACLVEVVRIQGSGPVPVRRQRLQPQLAAPSAASPSSLHI